jgi:threonine dehydrogenase-like Zn-dependent dehydrogenase
LRAGDRVVVPSTVGCYCSHCRAGYFDAGGLDGHQAEYARIPISATRGG